MLALQRVLIGVGLGKKVLIDIGFAKSISRYWSSKKVLVNNSFASISEVFTRR